MAQDDRWTLKILSLPIFSDEFSQALLKTPLANLAFVHAVDVNTGSEFVDQIAEWASGWDGVSHRLCVHTQLHWRVFGGLHVLLKKFFFNQLFFNLGLGCAKQLGIKSKRAQWQTLGGWLP